MNERLNIVNIRNKINNFQANPKNKFSIKEINTKNSQFSKIQKFSKFKNSYIQKFRENFEICKLNFSNK